MTTAVHAQDLGVTLYRLLADLEPARWRDEKRHELELAFQTLSDRVEVALKEWPDTEEWIGARAHFDEVRSIIEERLPSQNDIQTRWMEFRGEVHLAYEALADALKSCHVELPSVRPTNYARSAFHVLAGVIALLIVEYVPWAFVIAIPMLMCAVAWTMEIGRRFSDGWNEAMMRLFAHVAHPHERYRVNSSTWFLTALTILALLHEPIAGAMAVMVLGCGDPAAALVGRRWGRTKLVNNRSLEGTLTFAVVSFGVCLLVLYGWHADVATGLKFAIAGAAAVVGALVELFTRRLDDNFAIPVSVGLVVWAILAIA